MRFRWVSQWIIIFIKPRPPVVPPSTHRFPFIWDVKQAGWSSCTDRKSWPLRIHRKLQHMIPYFLVWFSKGGKLPFTNHAVILKNRYYHLRSDTLRLVATSSPNSNMCSASSLALARSGTPAHQSQHARFRKGDDRTRSIIFITNAGRRLRERPLTFTQACAVLLLFSCALCLNIVAASVFRSVAQRRRWGSTRLSWRVTSDSGLLPPPPVRPLVCIKEF